MSRKLKLAGGEALSNPKEITRDSMVDSLVDLRFYPFKGTLPTNISTEEAEFIPYEAKSLTTNTLEWEVEPSMKGYIDFANSFIVTERKPQLNGADLVPASNGAQRTIFRPWHSLVEFKDSKLFLNGKDVGDTHDGSVLPYASLHKAVLTEKNLDNLAGNISYQSPHGIAQSAQLVPTCSKASFEDLYDWGTCNVDSSLEGGNCVGVYKYFKALKFNEYVNGTTGITRLRDGIWKQEKFIPPATQIRLQLIKNDVSKVLHLADGGTWSGLSVLYTKATLYLRRVYPHDETIDSIVQLAQSIPRVYPLVKGNTTYFNIPSGSSGFNRSSLLTGSKPSVVVLQFVSATAFNGTGNIHPFSSESGANRKPDVSSLFLRVGSRRYPQNYDYGHEQASSLADANAFNEYIRCCEPDAGNTLPSRPMINPLNGNLNMYVFNTRQNNENMFDRADDDTGLDGVEVHCKFNYATSGDTVCVMTSFSNDVMTIDPNGKVLMDN